MIPLRVPHPFAFFAKGWDTTNHACPTLAAGILSGPERREGESKDLRFVVLAQGGITYFRRSLDIRVHTERLAHFSHAKIFSPCFSTISNNLSAMPLGLFAPDSHFSTVDSLVLR